MGRTTISGNQHLKSDETQNFSQHYIREYHGGCFGGVLEAVSSSVSVIETFPKWTKSSFNREHSFAKMFLMEF